jgi:hypothetical protein
VIAMSPLVVDGPGAAPAPSTGLLTLPDETLVMILGRLRPAELARLSMASAAFNSWISRAPAAVLWQHHCAQAAIPLAATAGAPCAARRAYYQHARTLCIDCNRPTPYVFQLLGRRLCEACERSSPHRYALATGPQLFHEESFDRLSVSRRRSIYDALPSISRGGTSWYLRAQAVAAAERWMPREAVEVTASEDGANVAEGAEHAILGKTEASKAALREAQKEHKRKVKAANRMKREGGSGAPIPLSSSPATASFRPRLASKSKHRAAAPEPNAWEKQYEALEARLGPLLSGLSGLTLAEE